VTARATVGEHSPGSHLPVAAQGPATLLQLVRPTARALPWVPVLLASFAAILLAATQDHDRLMVLRMDAVILAVGAGFVLDDPTEDSLAGLPTRVVARRTLRVALALPALALAWWQTISVAPAGPFEAVVPVFAVTLEAATMLVWTVALSAGLSPLVPERFGGIVAGPTLAVLVTLSLLLPAGLRLWVSPDDPRWSQAHRLWGVGLALGAALFLWWSRDPWRRRWLSRGPAVERSPQDARRRT
jgi:hypothetical protein